MRKNCFEEIVESINNFQAIINCFDIKFALFLGTLENMYVRVGKNRCFAFIYR